MPSTGFKTTYHPRENENIIDLGVMASNSWRAISPSCDKLTNIENIARDFGQLCLWLLEKAPPLQEKKHKIQ